MPKGEESSNEGTATGDPAESIVEIDIEKEGELEFCKKSKWHNYHFMLSGGGLYYKSRAKDPELKGILKLQTATINFPSKKPSSWDMTIGKQVYHFAASNEEIAKQWVDALLANCGQKLGNVALGKKKQSRSMAFKKNIAGKASSSAFVKTMIAELSKSDSFTVYMKTLKQAVRLYADRKKETEIEDGIYQLLAKVLLLYRNGDLLESDFDDLFGIIKHGLSITIDYLELPFAFEVNNMSKYWTDVSEECIRLISNYVTEKTVVRTRELAKFLSDESFQTFLFTDEKCEEIREVQKQILRMNWAMSFSNKK